MSISFLVLNGNYEVLMLAIFIKKRNQIHRTHNNEDTKESCYLFYQKLETVINYPERIICNNLPQTCIRLS